MSHPRGRVTPGLEHRRDGVNGVAGGAIAQPLAGAPKPFQRGDLENPVTREFCGDCGTPLLSKAPTMPGAVMLKVGSLDDPAVFGGAQMAIYTCDKQGYHQLPEGVPAFERLPG